LEVLDHPEVNGLPELIAERREVRVGDAPEIQAGRDAVGQPQDLAAQSVAPGRLVLGHVAGLDESRRSRVTVALSRPTRWPIAEGPIPEPSARASASRTSRPRLRVRVTAVSPSELMVRWTHSL